MTDRSHTGGVDPLTVMVATPLEPELVQRIDEVAGIEVVFEPELLPPPRYPSDHAGDPSFERSPTDENRFRELLAGAEVLLGVPGETPQALRAVVDSCPRLRWIQGTAAGAGQQVRAAGLAAEDLERVTVTSAVGVHAGQLAEWALLGLLYFVKDVPRLTRDARARRWPHHPVRGLSGQHLLVVGLGHIGQQVARLARALGMRVTGVRRHPDDSDLEHVDATGSVEDLPTLVPECDAVVLALPSTSRTHGLFDADLIRALPGHAVLVNVGRGSTVDEDALVTALREGRLLGAALDVVATEPLPQESPLWDLENVLLSPHTAALSTRENELIVELFVDNLRRFTAGRPLRNLVDVQEFY